MGGGTLSTDFSVRSGRSKWPVPSGRRLAVAAALAGLSLAASHRALRAQVAVGDVVTKDVLVRELPASGLRDSALELVRAETRTLSSMRVRLSERDRQGGIVDSREAFLAYHAKAGRGAAFYDRATLSVRTDSSFKVLYVAEMDPGIGFVERLQTLAPPGGSIDVQMLHVRYAQTGSGRVTEDLLFVLDERDRLVSVPIIHEDGRQLLVEGEYFCCGRFTDFDEDRIEFTTFITRGGRPDVTHRVRSTFRLEGGFRFDTETQLYVPDFRLVVSAMSGREEVGDR
jgi:hypothetical protein